MFLYVVEIPYVTKSDRVQYDQFHLIGLAPPTRGEVLNALKALNKKAHSVADKDTMRLSQDAYSVIDRHEFPLMSAKEAYAEITIEIERGIVAKIKVMKVMVYDLVKQTLKDKLGKQV